MMGAMMRPMKATPVQIKCLFAVAKQAGMDNDALHDRARIVTGQEHISKLTVGQAAKLIDSITGKDSGEPGVSRPTEERPIDRASQRQINVILGLARKLGWLKDTPLQSPSATASPQGEAFGGSQRPTDRSRLNGFLRSKYGVECIDWLEPDNARNCIEAMKAMLAGGRKERKGYHAEGSQ